MRALCKKLKELELSPLDIKIFCMIAGNFNVAMKL